MRKYGRLSDKLTITVIYGALILLSVVTLLPLFQVITVSMSPAEVINSYGFHFFPTEFDFSGYKQVMNYDLIWISYQNTIVRTILGTVITVVLTFMGAYALSKRTLPHNQFWTWFVVLTMFFEGGLIPTYILIRNLDLMNTLGALVLPAAVNAFYLLIVRNFLREIPESLEESAKIDGANDIYILWKIMIPLSMPILATISLYTAVWHWNAWFDSMIYIQDQSKQVLQMILRRIILEGTLIPQGGETVVQQTNLESMKMATLVISIVPILSVYPFLQKYFVKGMMLGSVKG